jgi:DNA-binding NarL/FixJ family response regulator
MALVELSRSEPPPLSDEVLRSQFKLTSWEIEVARNVAGALSSSRLAQRLGIRRSTARRHTESVLRKLGLHNRDGIAARLSE